MNDEASKKSSLMEKFLVFDVGEDKLGIPLLDVREVIGVPTFTAVPYTPQYFCGIMNLRGQVISVVDLRKKLGSEPSHGEEESVIICDTEKHQLGILVDSVNFVHAASMDELSEKPKVNSSIKTDFIKHVCRRDKDLIIIIDLFSVLSQDDHSAIEKSMATGLEKTAS